LLPASLCPRFSSEPYLSDKGEKGKKAITPPQAYTHRIPAVFSPIPSNSRPKATKIPRRPSPNLEKLGRPTSSESNSFIKLTNCKVLNRGYQELLSKILILLFDLEATARFLK